MSKDKLQKILMMVSFVLPTILLGMFVFATFFLPDSVAMHFNASGNVTRFGNQSELILLGIALYLIPMIMAIIFANVKVDLSKIIGFTCSIVVSVVFIIVFAITLGKIFEASGRGEANAPLWVSFALAIIGFICIITSHILPFVKSNLVFCNHNIRTLKHSDFNKINFVFSLFVFLFGLTLCVSCSLIKNYYSFIALFVSLIVYGVLCFLLTYKIAKNKRILKEDYNVE